MDTYDVQIFDGFLILHAFLLLDIGPLLWERV